MSKIQDSLPVSDAEPDLMPDHPSDMVAIAYGDAFGELGMNDGAGSGGHTLLSRPSESQGRRSLFRR